MAGSSECHAPCSSSGSAARSHGRYQRVRPQDPAVQICRGDVLTSLRTIIELISATTIATGLTVQAAHDPEWYQKGVRITDTELAAVPLHPHCFHGEWNYTINAQSNPA